MTSRGWAVAVLMTAMLATTACGSDSSEGGTAKATRLVAG
jgi:hypothetical protein